jgi:hypothetical protein
MRACVLASDVMTSRGSGASQDVPLILMMILMMMMILLPPPLLRHFYQFVCQIVPWNIALLSGRFYRCVDVPVMHATPLRQATD